MVEIKLESRQIVFRVIYLGGESSAKFATLRALQEGLARGTEDRITVLHAGGDRIVGFSHCPADTTPVFGMEVAINALTIPASLNTPANEDLLLRAADAVIWLDDLEEGADRQAAQSEFRSVLETLQRSKRAPSEFPVFVQGRAEDAGGAWRNYARPIGGFRPQLRLLDGSGSTTPGSILAEVEAEILTIYRRWERELERRGMTDHIKIRDRIYEKVCLTAPQDTPDEGTLGLSGEPEVRLIRSADSGVFEVPRWILVALLFAVVLAATLVSFML